MDEHIFVVDDDPSMLRAIDNLLRSVGYRVRLYGDVGDLGGVQLADLVGCMVLDVRLGGANGLDLHRQMRSAGMDIPVIFITGHGDVPMSVQAMKSGASDFLLKPFRDQDLLDAVSLALSRGREQRAEKLAAKAVIESYSRLSPREKEIMALVIRGLLNKQIAAELQLSEIMVKVHRSSVMKKMGVKSLADLVRASERIPELARCH